MSQENVGSTGNKLAASNFRFAKGIISFFLTTSFFCGCSVFNDNQKNTYPVASIEKADHLIFKSNMDSKFGETRDAETIKKIKTFIGLKSKYWYVPWYGVPVHKKRIEFYSDGKFLGYFGIGPNFFETQIGNGFLFGDAKENEISEILILMFERK